MALPATDSFTGSDGTQLTTYSANWTLRRGDFDIYSNQLRNDDGGSEAYNAAYWNADSFDNDQYAELDITSTGGTEYHYLGPAVRISTSANTWYGVYATESGNSEISKIVAGSRTLISNFNFNSPATIRLEAEGTTVRVTNSGSGTGVSDTTDSSIASGAAGISGWDWADGSNSNTLGDNWEGGDLGGGGDIDQLAGVAWASVGQVATVAEANISQIAGVAAN